MSVIKQKNNELKRQAVIYNYDPAEHETNNRIEKQKQTLTMKQIKTKKRLEQEYYKTSISKKI